MYGYTDWGGLAHGQNGLICFTDVSGSSKSVKE